MGKIIINVDPPLFPGKNFNVILKSVDRQESKSQFLWHIKVSEIFQKTLVEI